MGKTLNFLDKETKDWDGRRVKHRGRDSQSKVVLEVDSEVMDEVGVCVKTLLLQELWQRLSKKMRIKERMYRAYFELVPFKMDMGERRCCIWVIITLSPALHCQCWVDIWVVQLHHW